jgi:phytol kinase
VKQVAYFVVAFTGGLLVRYKGIRTNYTRKINHFVLFFLPTIFESQFNYESTLTTAVLSFVFGIISLVIYIKPVRDRVEFVKVAFSSFDRPEDRPHTLLWLSTQITATYLVIIPLIIYLYSAGKMSLLAIPVIINGVGDGLAEPVGIRFGKHTYSAYALFSRKKYVRSIEGSACIFITSIITTLALHPYFSVNQLCIALIVIPIVMTLAEAIAPHTWDSPFLFAIAGLTARASTL